MKNILHPSLEYMMVYASFMMALWGSLLGKRKDDQDTLESHDLVLSTLSDADTVNKIDLHTGKNLRNQITIEEAIRLHEERELLRMKGRRN